MGARRRHRAHRGVIVGAVMAIGAIIVACHSDYGDAPNDGDFSGHCFPNNTCNAGLICTQGVCLHDDSSDGGVVDASNPTTTGDASFVKEGSVPSDASSSDALFTFDGPNREDAAVSDATVCISLTGTVQNGGPCTQANECCSNMCREDRVCVTSCKSLGDTCSSLSNNTCCVGSHCGVLTCVACIASGQTPSSGGNTPDPTSCCSRAVDASGKCH